MKIIDAKEKTPTFSIALVAGRFNVEVTLRLVDGAISRLREKGFGEDQITLAWVPGAVEIPLTAQRLARTGDFKAIICLGAVIRGETSHYDYVCDQVSQGCQRVMLEESLPVIFGVLTTDDNDQALDRAGGAHGNKGADCADVAIHMVSVLESLPSRR